MDILYFIDIIGVVSFAISGFLIAYRYELDILGIFLSSFVTAIGGGIIRDVLVNKTPVVFANSLIPFIILSVVILSFVFKIYKKENIERKKIFIFSDAVGLVSFSISGALAGIDNQFNFFGVVVLSFITAVGGGLIRDVLINHIPLILSKDFYGSIAIIIAFLIFVLNSFDAINSFSIFIVFIFGLSLRIIAIYQKWNLPKNIF